MEKPNPVRDRYIAELYDWLRPELLYHCFTGESDDKTLEHIGKLEPSLLEPLLNKAEREWPARLERIAAELKQEKQQSKVAVQQFVLNFSSSTDYIHVR